LPSGELDRDASPVIMPDDWLKLAQRINQRLSDRRISAGWS
jgi:hypothetical protein